MVVQCATRCPGGKPTKPGHPKKHATTVKKCSPFNMQKECSVQTVAFPGGLGMLGIFGHLFNVFQTLCNVFFLLFFFFLLLFSIGNLKISYFSFSEPMHCILD
jgi:hypothetical protein